MPRMISGIMMGSVDTYATTSSVFRFLRLIPSAPEVPISTAKAQLNTARIRLLIKASPKSLSPNSSRYHFKENPSQTEVSFEALKEYTTVRRIGI